MNQIQTFNLPDMLQSLPGKEAESYKYTDLRQKMVNLNVVPQKIDPIFSSCEIAPVFESDVWNIVIPEGRVVTEPIFVSWDLPAGSYVTPQLIIHLNAGASLTLVDHLEGTTNSWCNRGAQIKIGEGAKFHHITSRSGSGVMTEQTQVQVKDNGQYHLTNLATGFDTARHDLSIDLIGRSAQTIVKSATLLRGQQHGDLTAFVRHLAPSTSSSQTIRTILDDTARGVYQGKIYVDRLAQKTDGYQLSNALLLKPGSEMDTKPELEIYADDVKCSHGATTGSLDDDQLFYLMSRGIPEYQARAMLLQAFVTTLFDDLPEKVQTEFDQTLQHWLGAPL
jgi:Fe-S cluster assembly protein SufD